MLTCVALDGTTWLRENELTQYLRITFHAAIQFRSSVSQTRKHPSIKDVPTRGELVTTMGTYG